MASCWAVIESAKRARAVARDSSDGSDVGTILEPCAWVGCSVVVGEVRPDGPRGLSGSRIGRPRIGGPNPVDKPEIEGGPEEGCCLEGLTGVEGLESTAKPRNILEDISAE